MVLKTGIKKQYSIYMYLIMQLKDTQMGCVYASYSRLIHFRFCLVLARMNHFEVHLMILSQTVDSKVLRMAV